MSYTIKNTGGVLNIGQLMDFDGEIVDIAANKATLTAAWKDAAGDDLAVITVSEGGDDYDCKLDIALLPVVVVTAPVAVTPDCTGNYALSGTHNGENYYTRTDSAWILWYDGVDTWKITDTIDVEGDAYWTGSAIDELTANGTATSLVNGAITTPETLPLGSSTIRLTSSTDAIVPRNIPVDVLTVTGYNNKYSGTDTQALITGLNTLGSRSLNDLYGSNNVLIP